MTNWQHGWRTRAGWVLAAILWTAAPAAAQVFTGRLDVTVQDSTGAVLPGVTVTVSGPQNQEAVTDSQGEVHLLNLPVGTYQVKASLSGFADFLNRSVPVTAGSVVPLRVTLGVQGVAEQVQVSAGTPVIEPKKQTVSTSITNAELQNIPSARDPWVVLQTVPGVIVDRVNVGGSESGQQSNYIAKGATTGDNTWYMDGIPITDMTALGSSPSYYDFDMFQEMQVTTGGADAQQATPGVQMNFVLKSGTNTPHGLARTYYENKDLQSDNLPDDLVESLGGASGKGNRINKYADYGGEIGGPLMRDRLWGWASYGRTDVNIQTLAGVPDKTTLEDIGAKAQAAFTQALRGNFTFFSGNKKKDGRGAGPFNPPETTFIQDGPSKMYKGEINYVASSSLFLTARGAHVNGPFTLTPKGGLDNGQIFIDSDGVFHNSNAFTTNDRPQVVFNGDGNWFRGKHEVRFGASVRNYKDENTTRFAGDFEDIEIDPDGTTIAIALRPYHQVNRALYTSLYAGDTLSFGRVTLNGAVRFDRTTNSVDAITVAAHPVVPDVLPGVSAPAVENAVVWNAWSPRAGATIALGSQRKTIVRGSYASFASQLQAITAGNISAASYAYAYYLAVDENHNFNIEPAELQQLLFAKNILSDDPGRAVNRIDPNFSAPRTHEVVFGVDHELMANFGISASYTWRRYVNQLWNQAPPIGVTSADYVVDGRLTGTLPDGSSYDVPYYALRPDRAPEGAGTVTSNREGYHHTFNGLEIAATKRLSNRWMGRFGFAWNRDREYFDDPLQVDRRSDADHRRSAGQRRPRHRAHGRQQQVEHLSDAADLPVQRQRLLPGPVGRELRRQLHPAPGLQRDVLLERRRHQRSRLLDEGHRGDSRPGWRLPPAGGEVARRARGEALQVRSGAARARRRRLQRAEQRHRARPHLRRQRVELQRRRRDHEPAHPPLRRALPVLIHAARPAARRRARPRGRAAGAGRADRPRARRVAGKGRARRRESRRDPRVRALARSRRDAGLDAGDSRLAVPGRRRQHVGQPDHVGRPRDRFRSLGRYPHDDDPLGSRAQYQMKTMLRRREAVVPEARRQISAPIRTPAWTVSLGAATWADAAWLDGQVVVGAEDGRLHAFDEHGRGRWTFKAGGAIRSRASQVGRDLVVQADDGAVYRIRRADREGAVDREDRRAGHARGACRSRVALREPRLGGCRGGESAVHRHARRTHPRARRAFGRKGVGVQDRRCRHRDARRRRRARVLRQLRRIRLRARRATGALAWKHDTGGAVTSAVAVSGNRVLSGSRSYDLEALDARTGAVTWRRYFWFSWVESPATVAGASAYIGFVGRRDRLVDRDRQRTRQLVRRCRRQRLGPAGRDRRDACTKESPACATTSPRTRDCLSLSTAQPAPSPGGIPRRPPEPAPDKLTAYGFAGFVAVGNGKVFAAGLDGVLYAFEL